MITLSNITKTIIVLLRINKYDNKHNDTNNCDSNR